MGIITIPSWRNWSTQRLFNFFLVIQTVVIGWALHYYIILPTAAFLLSLINKYKQKTSIGHFQETGQIRDSMLLKHKLISPLTSCSMGQARRPHSCISTTQKVKAPSFYLWTSPREDLLSWLGSHGWDGEARLTRPGYLAYRCSQEAGSLYWQPQTVTRKKSAATLQSSRQQVLVRLKEAHNKC